jgi:peptide/nickel transport system permease protein
MTMFRFILKRLAAGVILLFVITSVAFFLLYLGGGDIARRILGQSASQEAVAAKAEQLGLNEPVLTQYTSWLKNALTGDFGDSWFTGQPVTEGIASRLWVTLSIVFGATVVIAIISVLLGVWAAVRGGWVDRVVQVITVLGFAIPGFIIALGLVLVFAINLGWFAPTGYVNFTTSPSGWLGSVSLPIIALAIGGIAGVTAQVRSSVSDAMRQDYVRTLRSRGLGFNRVVYKHVLRNAGGPALAVLAVLFVGLLSGAVIVEQVFAIPGLGQVAVISTSQGDIPMVLGLVVVMAAIVVLVNLSIDLLQGWLNPKVRV